MNRSPVVAILGHVDHGKTTLLDTIRKSRLAAREQGGITQAIGAYEIATGISGYHTDRITFIDTPGHEAFSTLRARGATVADIAILVIDASDSVMPQTIESMAHIKSAGIPFIVAINKIDLPGAKPDKVKKDLLKHEIITEDLGGTVIALPISAKKGDGVPELLESILLLAAECNLEYEPDHPVNAYIIESKKDQRGIVATVIIKDGRLAVGDTVYCGDEKIRVRSLINDLGKTIPVATPSMPFEMLGFSSFPDVGMSLTAEKQEPKKEKERAPDIGQSGNIVAMLKGEETEKPKQLSVVIKTDSQGSLDAILQSLAKNENILIALSAVGAVHRSDIFLAKTTKSIVIGFGVPVDAEVRELAKQEKVIIKTYTIIYELLDELEEVSDLMHEKEEKEKNVKAQAKVLASFIIEQETVFGALITKGKVNVGDTAEVYRNAKLIGKARLISLKIRAKSVQEVKKDQECGMNFSPVLDIQVGDVVKFIL